MAFGVTPHLNFRGQAREALGFYAEVFGGEQVMVTYRDMGQEVAADQADQIIWGQVRSPDGVAVMAFDILPPRPYEAGANAFFLALRGDTAADVEARWAALAEGGTVLQPLGPSSWSPLYGMVTDRFGVTWIVGLDQEG